MKGDMRYMKKSVYLGQQNVVDWVYSEKTKEELAARYEFVCGGRVLSKEMLAEAPESASEAEYLFSTWAMPVFTEDEVRRYFPESRGGVLCRRVGSGFCAGVSESGNKGIQRMGGERSSRRGIYSCADHTCQYRLLPTPSHAGQRSAMG